jgi:hypothetical protein
LIGSTNLIGNVICVVFGWSIKIEKSIVGTFFVLKRVERISNV